MVNFLRMESGILVGISSYIVYINGKLIIVEILKYYAWKSLRSTGICIIVGREKVNGFKWMHVTHYLRLTESL